MSNIQSRLGYGAGFLACTSLIAFAYYLQYVQYQEPCPLCILQRLAFFGLGIVFLVAMLHGPGRVGSVAYSGASDESARSGGDAQAARSHKANKL